MSVVEIIKHYQRSIEKCSGDVKRMLHCIEKLYRLPVTVQHLQETGVGRTVNGLRKYGGDVGDAAKALVSKWKTMVVDEDSSDGDVGSDDEANISEPPDDYGNQSHSTKVENDSSDEKVNRKESKSGSDHWASKHQSKSNRTESIETNSKNSSDDKSKSRNRQSHSSSGGEKYTHSKNETIKTTSNNNSKIDSDKREPNSESKSERKSHNKKDFRDEKRDSKREDPTKSKDKEKNRDKAESSKSKEHSRKRKTDDFNERQRDMKKMKHTESENMDENLGTYSPVIDDTKHALKTLSSDGESDNDLRVDIKVEPLSPSKNRDASRLHEEFENERKYSKKDHSSSKSKSSHANDKKRLVDKEKRPTDKLEDAIDHRKSENRKDDTGHEKEYSKSKSSTVVSSSKEKSKDKEKQEHRDKKEHKKSRDSKDSKESKPSKSSTSHKDTKEKKKIKKEINGDEGIDCNSGASFAEALGMCAFSTPSSRKKSSNSPNSCSSTTKPIKIEPSTSSTPTKPVPKFVADVPMPSGSDDTQPSLLAPNVKLEPLSVDLASTLPEISPNYKPLPYINPVHRKQEEDMALSQVIYAKNQRTKVYSGNKCGYANVPTLYDMCIRILIENIEALEFTGGVPYDIIKPVLERATPDQLFLLEHHNPYLIDDTDPLWRFHCNREFRSKQREEMETWREMYMRCLDEREAKLKALTENIKQSIDKSLPVRQTKLAYVDNVVKPPRNILRKQAKYGTARSTITSTSDLKNKLISGSGGTPTNISVPAPPISRSRTSAVNVTKKTKAPLMAKALQLIKGRYKR